MSNYCMIRGWIECAFEDVRLIKDIAQNSWLKFEDFSIEEETSKLYWKGWFFPEEAINWVNFIFYGATVNSISLPFVKYVLNEIAASNPELDGIFYLDDEDGSQSKLLLLGNGVLSESDRLV